MTTTNLGHFCLVLQTFTFEAHEFEANRNVSGCFTVTPAAMVPWPWNLSCNHPSPAPINIPWRSGRVEINIVKLAAGNICKLDLQAAVFYYHTLLMSNRLKKLEKSTSIKVDLNSAPKARFHALHNDQLSMLSWGY